MVTNSYWVFIKACVLSLFGSKKEGLIINDLFYKFSYRYTKPESLSFASSFRYFRRSVLLLVKRNNRVEKAFDKASYVYDNKLSFENVDKDYLKFNGVEKVGFISRDSLPNELNTFGALGLILQLLVLFGFLLPFSLLSKDKAKSSLILLELTENLLLAKALKNLMCKEVYVFSAFEKDTMFASYLLEQNGIKVYLVPSSNPISNYYKHVICHSFIFTAPFQLKEFEGLKENWFVKEKRSWKPFESHMVKLNKGRNVPPYKIGFVSSAMFLRAEMDHNNPSGNNDFEAEMALIEGLKMYLSKRKHSLIIYLHPFEKSSKENQQTAISFYEKQFGNQIAFAPCHELSKLHFNMCSLAVSGFSSAQIERLYGGYKVLFAPMGHMKNYFSDERLDAISAQSYNDLELKLDKILLMPDDTYFDFYRLQDYHWNSYELKQPSDD